MFANLETRLDRARDEGVRLTLKVGELSGKLREMRLRWFGHLAWIDDHNIGRRTWRMADGGWRMADGGWRMADGGWRMADGGWCKREGETEKTMG